MAKGDDDADLQAPEPEARTSARGRALGLVAMSSGVICVVLGGLGLVATVANTVWSLNQPFPFCAYWDYGFGLVLASIPVIVVCAVGFFLSAIAVVRHPDWLSGIGMFLSIFSGAAVLLLWVIDFGVFILSTQIPCW